VTAALGAPPAGSPGRTRRTAVGSGSAVAGCEHGSVAVWLPSLLVLAVMVAVVVIDLGGHLVAVSRAATLADSAALAAVSADVPGGGESPRSAAVHVVDAGGGRLETCDCPAGARRARVRVSVAVPGVAWPRLGAARQGAEAEAVLHEPVAPTERVPRGAATATSPRRLREPPGPYPRHGESGDPPDR
jgi:hypothetical protein